MKNSRPRAKSRFDKLKTLCTLDTSDILLTSDIKQIIDRNKNFPSSVKNKNQLKTKTNPRHSISLTQYKHQRSHAFSNQKNNTTIHQTRTIYTQSNTKKLRAKTKQRMKTQYTGKSPNKILLHNLQIFTNLKNVNFHMDQKYNVDPFYLVSTLKSTKQETIQTVKKLDKNYKPVYYTLKKSNHPKIIEKYHKEITIKQFLTDQLKPSQKKNLSCIHKVYKRDQQDNMLLLYELQGEPLSWKKTLSKRLIQNMPKNDMQILKHLIVQLSKAIHILSTYGYYHSQIRLKSVLLELKEDADNVKVSKVVKLGNLGQCHQIKDKKTFELMPHSIYTPPEILNFMIFQNTNKNFNRSWLECIYKYEDAWKISVWSLGILVLQILNEQPLHHTFLSIEEIIDYQKHLDLKCGYLFQKIGDGRFQNLLKKMLCVNPQQRPSPEQIIVSLTA